jgi:hypothetical protein
MTLARRAAAVVKLRIAVALGVLSAAPASAVMCTPSPIRVLRSAQVVELIAIATPRTVEAGAGPVEPKDQSDRPIRRPGPIFGQVVRAQRVHVDYLQRLGLRSPSQPVDVVVVPWGSNGSCSRMIVPGRGPWFDAGSRALIFGELRERRHWVGGRPTIDLTDVIPDPGTSAVADASFTPDRMLDLSEAMPRYARESLPESAYAEVRPLQRWIREHPALRAGEARGIVSYALLNAERRRMQWAARPMTGSYRFDVVLSPRDSVSLLARTERMPSETVWWFASDSTPFWSITTEVPRAEGFSLRLRLARNASALRGWIGYPDDEARHMTSVDIAEVPAFVRADSTVWSSRGLHVDPVVALLRHLPLPAGARAARDLLVVQFARGELTGEGRFFRMGRGAIRYDGTILRAGTPVVRIRGRRVSPVTIPEY